MIRVGGSQSNEHHDYRGYSGTVAGGVLHAGDEVVVLPGGQRTEIEAIETYDGPVETAFPTMSVTVRVKDDLDISRGDMLVEADDPPSRPASSTRWSAGWARPRCARAPGW